MSIRQALYEKWIEEPYLSNKRYFEELGLERKKHGQYIKNLLSEFRRNYQFERSQSPHYRRFELEFVPFDRTTALSYGWVESVNHNKRLIFRDKRGTVNWFQNGRVIMQIKGQTMLAKVKELFCRAFSWFDVNE